LNKDKLINFLDSLEGAGIPGCDCIVYHNHQPVFRHMAGYANKDRTKPISGETYYWIYSVSKLITCAAAMQLIEGGSINLDDPVYEYLPEYKDMKVRESSGVRPARNKITIRHLLSMQSGLNYNINAPSIVQILKETNGQASTRQLIKALAKEPLDFEPGTRFQYSLSHDVLGAVIEVVSGKPLDCYIEEKILLPLDMYNTGFELTPEKQDGMSEQFLYNVLSKTSKSISAVNDYVFTPNYKSGGAGLISTVEDVILFLDAMCNGGVGANGNRILAKESIDLMRTDQLSDIAREDYIKMDYNRYGYSYGLGGRVLVDKSMTNAKSPVGEFGWDGAAGASALIDSDNRVAIFYAQHVRACDYAYKTVHPKIRDLTYEMLNLDS
jgi:CubicO group peptidase (beta-lactamase class C family)